MTGCVLGNEPIPPEPHDYYAYSASPYVRRHSLGGLALVNRAAGCNLVGTAEAGEYVLPIWEVEEHDSSPTTIGCAYIDEMFADTKYKRPIRLVSYVLRTEHVDRLVAHEVGHTLGLHHSEDGFIMAESVNMASDDFSPEDASYLRYLCDYLPNYED